MGGGIVVGLSIVVAGNSISRYLGWAVHREDPLVLAETLRPYYRIVKPAGTGLFPTALLYSGCDGPRDNLDRWSQMLNKRGWAAIIVDSHTPRVFLDYDIWRLLCAGQLFMGSQRAGDVLISIYDARRMYFVDRDRIVLIGSSHGGWAIMELLAFEAASRLPFGLAALPDDMLEKSLDGVIGAILLYPYCGLGNRSRRTGWSQPLPVLFLLSGNDTIAPASDCLRIAEVLVQRGVPVETFVFDGVTHGFDQEDRAVFSTLEFDAKTTAEALRIGSDFLGKVNNRPTAP